MKLVNNMLAGDVLSLARLITKVERDVAEVPEIMRGIYQRLGKSYCVGITGPPGAGKSTIVDRLTAVIRQQELTVGIIAADPTSPFTGGAVLGDRIRMQQHYLDEGVFIRSMATRGSHGGLPRSTGGVIKLLDAFGKDFVLVETVGVGQTELDIMENADTVVVILVPEAGDTVQTMKAGLFEIADIFVVNKADRPGADNLLTELNMMVQHYPKERWWQVPVLATQAVNNVGIEELFKQIEKHRQALEGSGQLLERRRQQRRREFLETVEHRVSDELLKLVEQDEEMSRYMARVEAGELDPYSAADEILRPRTLLASWSRQLAEKRPNE
ncbi:MAG: methylmalonyl Co-A mutase-associated GTPase MeaB [Chloroflexi bacterium]|nr:methylmalonyl Co-A mutase-associated GTPase MeaB [Chloroflexota bacterium]MBM4452055.1 methylmalonyl Co-A mutase-associated GTPase MeaB [Chloroflexota bacterium]MBM4453023.1 methylmalonyl Co-A mutase-associated GTPase MeaB [Chloroflexota bacterium]